MMRGQRRVRGQGMHKARSMLTIVQGITDKPVAAQRLAALFQPRASSLEGFLYIGYPIVGTPEGPCHLDAALISPRWGLVIFDLIEGETISGAQERQDDATNKVVSRLLAHKDLTAGRNLLVPVNAVSFAPALSAAGDATDRLNALDEARLLPWIRNLATWSRSHLFAILTAVLQSTLGLRQGRDEQRATQPCSRGGKLKTLEKALINLDARQSRAVLETKPDAQRIRGLSGTGKSTVLALKAAYLHAKRPDWQIAISFNLITQKVRLRKIIQAFLADIAVVPNWDNLQLRHIWGEPVDGQILGLYAHFCHSVGAEFHLASSARRAFGIDQEIQGACRQAVDDFESQSDSLADFPHPYDAILLEDAHDLPPAFFQLCYRMLDENKRLIYAYDEWLQPETRAWPQPGEFDYPLAPGRAPVERRAGSRQDIILRTCFRTPRPILVTAHALGLGIYRNPAADASTELLPNFAAPQVWRAAGYEAVQGDPIEGKDVHLARAADASPAGLERHSATDDLIRFIVCPDAEEQARTVARCIQTNLERDELTEGDIVVINLSPLASNRDVGHIRSLLHRKNIRTLEEGIVPWPEAKYETRDAIVFHSLHRARRDAGGMVYVINAQAVHEAKEHEASARKYLYSALTRSQAWVRVLGIGSGMQGLQEEFSQVRAHDFQLTFAYPSAQPIRGPEADSDDDRIRERLQNFLQDIESNGQQLTDLDQGQLDRLKQIFASIPSDA